MSIEGTELMMNFNDPVAPEPDAAVLRVMVIVPGLVEMILGLIRSYRNSCEVERNVLCVSFRKSSQTVLDKNWSACNNVADANRVIDRYVE